MTQALGEKMMKTIHIIPFLCFTLFAGCRSDSTGISEASIRTIAELAAQDEKYDLSRFEEPEIKRDTMNGKSGWMFYYDGKMKAPGNHFMVWIESGSDKAVVLHGE